MTAQCSHGFALDALKVPGHHRVANDGMLHTATQIIVGRWEPCDDAELIEDQDGAPIPGPLQRDGEAYKLIREFMEAYPAIAHSSPEVRRTVIDSLAVHLAPYVKLEVDA